MTLLTALFFGFFAIIVIFQLVPAAIMFYSMIKGLFFHKAEVNQ